MDPPLVAYAHEMWKSGLCALTIRKCKAVLNKGIFIARIPPLAFQEIVSQRDGMRVSPDISFLDCKIIATS
jgi:hypothetical protein